jgi:predicted ATP-dependent protease
VPYENKAEIPQLPGMQVIPVKRVEEALPLFFKVQQALIKLSS